MQHIIPSRLRDERIQRGWTQKELASKAGLSLRVVVALEKEREDGLGHPLRWSTLEKLRDALNVPEARLTEDSGLSASRMGKDLKVEIRMSHHERLRFDLLEAETGVTMHDLISSAPLLFKLAERISLAWRRDELDRARAHLAGLREASGYILNEKQKAVLEDIEQEFVAEAASIEAGELFKPSDRFENTGVNSNRFLDWVDVIADDPEDIELIGLRKVILAPTDLHVPHNVCRKTLHQIAGRPDEDGAEQAIYALATGAVRLKDIPSDLRTEDRRADRIAWLGSHADAPEEGWCIDTFPSLQAETRYASTRSS